MSGMDGLSTTSERVAGYRLGLEQAGLCFQHNLVCCGRSAAAPAERAITSLLARRNPPTAIVSSNNYMTIGVLRALQRNGMRVPEDIAVVAYDDLDFGGVFQPRMTVMAQPVSEIASKPVSFLISRITGKGKTRDPQRIQIAATFIHRESCGCGLRGHDGRDGGSLQS